MKFLQLCLFLVSVASGQGFVDVEYRSRCNITHKSKAGPSVYLQGEFEFSQIDRNKYRIVSASLEYGFYAAVSGYTFSEHVGNVYVHLSGNVYSTVFENDNVVARGIGQKGVVGTSVSSECGDCGAEITDFAELCQGSTLTGTFKRFFSFRGVVQFIPNHGGSSVSGVGATIFFDGM